MALETGMRSDEERVTKESLHEKNRRSGADAPRFRHLSCLSLSSGATRRNRTGDLLITNQSLYQLS